MSDTHLLSTKQANELHDKIVKDIATSFSEHSISYPDKEPAQEGVRRPDIFIDNELLIEVKVLNPTNSDAAIDKNAERKWKKLRRTDCGGTLNPSPLEEAVSSAAKQLSTFEANYKLLVIYSPLIWQMEVGRAAHLLTGLDTLTLYDIKGESSIGEVSKTSVALKRKYTINIDGVLYLNQAHFNNRIFWKLNDKDSPLLGLLNAEVEDFWKSRVKERVFF